MLTPAERHDRIEKIRNFPAQLEALVVNLTDQQLDAHLPDEWSTRQNVHHVADSHMNAFIRFKLALTEKTPVIKPYLEAEWAKLPDTVGLPIAPSLLILHGLHQRWATLLDSLTDEQWARTAYHPEQGRVLTLDDFLITYSNHGDAHIEQLSRALTAAI
jgi:hypothetical protein